MRRWLRSLSAFKGLKHSLLPGCTRRGAAYLLAQEATTDERNARMGHKPTSDTWFNYYRMKKSTFDFQAIAHNTPQVDVATMSSISLGAEDSAPQSISREGMTRILVDPNVISLTQQHTTAIDALITKFASKKLAEEKDPSVYGALARLEVDLRNL